MIFRMFYHFLLLPFGLLMALLLSLFGNKKIKRILQARFKSNSKSTSTKNKNSIWFHCASGEFEYAKPVIRELKLQAPHIPILVTYFSTSFQKNIEQDPHVDEVAPLPFDFPGSVSSFLQKYQPQSLWISRTDLWPELLLQCQQQNIPVSLFSATLSHPAKGFKKFLAPWTWQRLVQIFAVREEDQKNLQSLAPQVPVEALGDTRYDQVLYRLRHPRPHRTEWFSAAQQPPLFIAGSTWIEDEKVLLPALLPLVKENKIRLALVPHEPTDSHIQELQQTLQTWGIEIQLYNSMTNPLAPLLIVDQVGVLADLYPYARWALVGNSFKDHKVHSVMEPLAAGCLTFVGPKHHNNSEALLFKKLKLSSHSALAPLTVVESSDPLTQQVKNSLNVTDASLIKSEIQNLIQARTGASQKLVQQILHSLR